MAASLSEVKSKIFTLKGGVPIARIQVNSVAADMVIVAKGATKQMLEVLGDYPGKIAIADCDSNAIRGLHANITSVHLIEGIQPNVAAILPVTTQEINLWPGVGSNVVAAINGVGRCLTIWENISPAAIVNLSATMVNIATASETAVAHLNYALVQAGTILGLRKGAKVAAVRKIPEFFNTIMLNHYVTEDAVAALQKNIIKVIIGPNVTEAAIAKIPDHVREIRLQVNELQKIAILAKLPLRLRAKIVGEAEAILATARSVVSPNINIPKA